MWNVLLLIEEVIVLAEVFDVVMIIVAMMSWLWVWLLLLLWCYY